MRKAAYACLITSVVTMILAIVVYTVAVGNRMFVIGTPPGVVAASLFGLVSAVSGICGLVLAVIQARGEQWSRPSLLCLGFNASYVGGIALLVVAGLVLQSHKEAESAAFMAKYEAQNRDEGVVTAKREIDGYLIGNLKQGVVLLPLWTFAPLTNRSLSNGFKIVGVYLPKSGDETRDKERDTIVYGMGNAAQALVGYLVKQGKIADAVILLEAMEEAHCPISVLRGKDLLGAKELRSELSAGAFKAEDYAKLLDENRAVAGYLTGL
jgi:hypothetical protein